jgi:DNA-binding response OmpR family regulator
MRKLLVIDDEPERTEQVADWFVPLGYEVIRAHSGREGVQKAKELQPDIVVVDIIMPEMSGHEVLIRLKRDRVTTRIPVVIFTITGEEPDRLQDLLLRGLREGADYIIVKKWGLPALEAAVERLFKKVNPPPRIRVRGYELTLGEGCVEVWVNGNRKRLAPLEAKVLAYLNDCRGQPCNVREIEDNVWRDRQVVGDENRVRRIIARLRDKIEPDRSNPIFIVTVTGFGYELTEGEE